MKAMAIVFLGALMLAQAAIAEKPDCKYEWLRAGSMLETQAALGRKLVGAPMQEQCAHMQANLNLANTMLETIPPKCIVTDIDLAEPLWVQQGLAEFFLEHFCSTQED